MTSFPPTPQTPVKRRLNSAFVQLMSVHWWMSVCYLVLFVVGTLMAQLPRGNTLRTPLYDFHKSIGVLSMALLTWRILLLLRVWWHKYTRRLPKFTPQWVKTVALHVTLYIFMWAVPIAGFLLSNSFKSGNVKFFGIPLPDLFPQNADRVDLGRGLHFWLSYTFLAFIILHIIEQKKVAQALWRRFSQFVRMRSS